MTMQVLQVTRHGDVANVVLVIDVGTEGTWFHLNNLLKIDGVWKITNKAATHISGAGEMPRARARLLRART